MKTITTKNLDALQVPTPDMEQHRQALKNALLTSSHWNKKTVFNNFLWKGGEFIVMKKNIVFLGSALGIILVGFFLVTSMQKNATTAYAQEVVKQTYQNVKNLTPEQQDALKKQLAIDNAQHELQEAQNAPDLTVLSYKQFVAKYPQFITLSNAKMAHDPDTQNKQQVMQANNKKLQTAEFLEFTNSQGIKIIMGVDHNLPIFYMESNKLQNSVQNT